MKIPSKDHDLVAGLRSASSEVPRGEWMAHLLKHPLGIGALAATDNRGPWNAEGWDRVRPPIIEASQRSAVLQKIGELENAGLRCELPEVRGRSGSNPAKLACKACPTPIVAWCEKLLHNGTDGPGERYARVVDDLLAAFDLGRADELPRARLLPMAMRALRTPGAIEKLTVMTVGGADRDANMMVARISRGDGVRVEFALEVGTRLRWRTTYRENVAGFPAVSFVSAMLQKAMLSGRLSDIAWVPRPWLEAHGA